MNEKQVAKLILTTKGINSKVLVEGDRQKLKTIGHVGLFDFDGISKQHILDNCLELEGINILWKSSSTGFHLWNLCVRSVDEIALLGLRLGSDCKHVAHGFRQSKWILRTTPKKKENGNQYKPAPKLLHTWVNPSMRIQSKPHYRMFVALTGKCIIQVDNFEYRGLSAEIEDYQTLTDSLKRKLSNG